MKRHLPLIFILLSISISSQARVLTTCTSSLPTVTGITTVCGSESASVTVSGEAIQYWYTTSIGGLGTSVTGTVFATPMLTANTNFWITSSNGNCESDRVGITAHVFTKPLQPTVTGLSTLCGSGNIQIKVSSEFENIWYTSSIGGTALDTTGAVFNTSIIADSTVYWVSGYTGDKGCESGRAKVVGKVFETPNKPIVLGFPIYITKIGDVAYPQCYSSVAIIPELPSYYNRDKLLINYINSRESYGRNNFNLQPPPFSTSEKDTIYLTVSWLRGGTSSIQVFLTSKQGCVSDTNILITDLSSLSGTNGIYNENFDEINISPNPGNGVFRITSNEIIISVEAINSLGQKERFKPPFIQIITSFKGLVLLNIQTKNGRVIKRIIVE